MVSSRRGGVGSPASGWAACGQASRRSRLEGLGGRRRARSLREGWAAGAPYLPYSRICYHVWATWYGGVVLPSPLLKTHSPVPMLGGVQAIRG
ncbi:hypothetical protein E2C01_020097 [Portunus trituberculatus]|uniref:Uncharacterized protein n=1 Tax=Portunus trituberculatus TaxID=210409 RepID=A0A5B7E0E5_PORTR|nr:hypothetical protein [Portunus trituberculatus]